MSYGTAYTTNRHKLNIEGTYFDILTSRNKAHQRIHTTSNNSIDIQDIEKNNKPDLRSYSFSGGYRFSSDDNKNKLNLIASYIKQNDDFVLDYSLRDSIISEPKNEIIENQSTSSMFYTQLDFTQKIYNAFDWSIGTKYSATNRDNTNIFTDNSYTTSTDQYNYKEIIPSAFIDSKLSINNLYITAGIRFEHTRLKSHGSKFQQKYTELFPSMTASYILNKGYSIRVNYSRSIFRPPFALLNNYRVKTSEQEYSVGNPALKAQKTDIIGISLIANNHVFRLSWAKTPNPITNTIYSKQDTLLMTNINGSEQYAYNISHSFNGNIASFWHLSSDLGIQYLSLPKSDYKKHITQGYITLLNTFTVIESLKLKIDGRYSSPWIMNDRKIEDKFNINLLLNYSIPKHNLTITLLGKNVIARRRTSSITENKYVSYNSWKEIAPFSIELGFSWRFFTGKKKDIQQQKLLDKNLDKYRL